MKEESSLDQVMVGLQAILDRLASLSEELRRTQSGPDSYEEIAARIAAFRRNLEENRE